MRGPELSPQVFAILSALIEEKTGLHYKLEDRDLLGDKLSARVEQAGFDSFLDYYYYLRYDPEGAAELNGLVDSIVVGETYLFREYEQLVVAIEEFIAPKVASGQRARIWSAACATGEEPFSVAILLANRGMLERVDVVASDISPRALERARRGRLARRALRRTPPADLSGYWSELAGGELEVSANIREAITWHQVNLIDGDAIDGLGAFDVVLCRNVLIYFSDDTSRRVIENLGSALRPGGVLLVGMSESLLRLGTSLLSEERRGTFIYRRQP